MDHLFLGSELLSIGVRNSVVVEHLVQDLQDKSSMQEFQHSFQRLQNISTPDLSTMKSSTINSSTMNSHTVIFKYSNIKNKHLLILPSDIARNSLAPNAKNIFEILWGNLEGRTNSARPSLPCLKNCQNGTFWSVHGIWIFFWPKWLHLRCY